MSNLNAIQKDGNLVISLSRARVQPDDNEIIDLITLPIEQLRRSVVLVKNKAQKFKVLLCEPIKGSDDTLLVYTDSSYVRYVRIPKSDESPLKRLVQVKDRVISVRLSRSRLAVTFLGYVLNPYKLPIKNQVYSVDTENTKKASLAIFKGDPSKTTLFRHIHTLSFSTDDLLKGGEPPINSPIRLTLNIDGMPAHYGLVKKTRSFKRLAQYYAPIRRTTKDGFSLSIRRYGGGGLVLVRRRLEDIEKTLWFRFVESRPVSFFLFHTAHIVRSLSKTKVNIYFEKLTSKAEEGTFQVFERVKAKSKNSRNYFLIRGETPDYERIRSVDGVVKNFTLKSYWLLYRANAIISTESQINANIMRSSNYYVRSAPYSQKFIFLQHGVTYLKCQGPKSAFVRDRENEPDLIVVGSEKEQDAVADMLRLEEERILNVGLPVFDTIQYGSITKDSDDIATIMLTWKPYEEHLYDFSKSVYYKSVVMLHTELSKHMPAENIRIVAHPKFVKLLKSTPIGDSISTEPISTILKNTKLLITDYSSVAYYSFYLGAAVIFYQEDIDQFEGVVGKLVPNDDEYIGHRAFSQADFRSIIKGAVSKGKITLPTLRTKEHEKLYLTINQYTDGKNVERLVDTLIKRKIV
jgi:CDP-glycerol glycerophosphotransferase (TagB/SpsB family)